MKGLCKITRKKDNFFKSWFQLYKVTPLWNVITDYKLKEKISIMCRYLQSTCNFQRVKRNPVTSWWLHYENLIIISDI